MTKTIVFDSIKFTRDDKTGYYLHSTLRLRLHRHVWTYHNGTIPKGYEVHHIDEDKSNNDISNLQLLTKAEHMRLHSNKRAAMHYDRIVKNLNENARPKATEWHKSDEGRAWHKEHYESMKDSLYEKTETVCEQCNDVFDGISHSRFCSNKCKSAWRRDSGIDDEQRRCPQCDVTFIVNKYSKKVCCSRSCANRHTPRLPQLKRRNADE